MAFLMQFIGSHMIAFEPIKQVTQEEVCISEHIYHKVSDLCGLIWF